MYRKTRKKIVASVMTALLLLFAVTLFVIVLSSYIDAAQQQKEMLARYTSLFSLDAPPWKIKVPADGPDDSGQSASDAPLYELSTFYSVAFSDTGDVLAIDRGQKGLHSDAELVRAAEEILAAGKTSGRMASLTYQTAAKDGYTLVAFMDSTVSDDSFHSLIRHTLLIGGAAILVCFFLADYLAYRIVRPLEENDRKQRQFISDAGHELRTPVSVISSNAELLARQIGSNEWLENICYENERMGDLITQLLDLSRAENRKMPMETLDLSRLVTGEMLPFESVAFERGLRIRSDIEEDVTVWGNRTQLSQLVSILLDNAIRHSDGGREIGLSLKAHSRFAVLTVENSGAEITKEHRDRLFERFYRVDEARSGEDRHYGLGLAIAKAITEGCGGRITVSCKEGKIIFRVCLPERKN